MVLTAAGGLLLLASCGDGDQSTAIAEGTATIFGRSVELNATQNGSEVSGSAEVTAESEPSFTISFSCVSEPAKGVVIIGGEISQSEDDERPAGMRGAVLLLDGEPVGMGMWFEDPPPAESCDEFLGGIPDEAVNDSNAYQPVDDITIGAEFRANG